MAQVETDGAELRKEAETEDLAYDEDEDLAYDYRGDDSDDTSDGEREYWRSIEPVPGYGWTELGDRVKALEEAVGYRCLKEAGNKLKYLKALQSSYWSQHNPIYKQDLESAICNGSLLLSVIRGDEPTFTKKINELKEFYRRPFPYPEQFTFMRLNLVKLLLDDDDDGFDAAIDFLVEAQSNCFWKQPRFFRFFTVREVVSFLGANFSMEGSESSSVEVKYLGYSMEGSESSSVEAVVVGHIIDSCANNLHAYLQKKGLEWEVWEFLESARDKWKKKTGFLICSCQHEKAGYLSCKCEKGPLEDLSRKQLIYEALAYLWFLLEDTVSRPRPKLTG